MPIWRSATRKRRARRPRYSGLLRVRDLRIFIVIVAAILAALVYWALYDCGMADCRHMDLMARVKSLSPILPFGPKSSGGSSSAGGVGTSETPKTLLVLQILIWFLAAISVIRVGLANVRRDFRVILARRRRGHVIVCGLGETGRQIAENLRWRKGGIVGIALNTDEPNAAALELLKVPVLKANAAQFGVLGMAGLRHADGVVVATGSDATNIEIALRVGDELAADRERWWPWFQDWVAGSAAGQAWRWLRRGIAGLPGLRRWSSLAKRIAGSPGPRSIFVLPEMRSPWLADLLHNNPTTKLGSGMIETRPFDPNANGARMLLTEAAFRRPLPPGVQPHFLLAGLGEMGAQIIVQAVCANYALVGRRLSVTVLDKQGEVAATGLGGRFPGLRDLVGLDFVKADFSAEDAATWNAAWDPIDEALRREDKGRATVAAIVALGDDRDSLHVALQLRRRLDSLRRFGTPVFVRVRHQPALAAFVAELEGEKTLFRRLVPFGDLESLTEPERLIGGSQDAFARAIHEAYLATRKPTASPSPAAVPWAQLSEWYKQSNRATADHLSAKLGLVGMRTVEGDGTPAEFNSWELELMAVAEHERWWIERKVLGWKRGDRDDMRRIHPNMVPWGKLDEDTRQYDRGMVCASWANLPKIKLTIRRERFIVAVGKRFAEAEAALDRIAADDERVIVATRKRLAEAEAVFGQIAADEVAIVVFDPEETASWEFAQRAAKQSAVLWVLWEEGRPGAPVPKSAVPPEVRSAVEAQTISTRELRALGL